VGHTHTDGWGMCTQMGGSCALRWVVHTHVRRWEGTHTKMGGAHTRRWVGLVHSDGWGTHTHVHTHTDRSPFLVWKDLKE